MKENNVTPAAFLAQLGKVLKAREGEDVELAEIVSKHLLDISPAEDCVEQALTAITALSSKRTSSPKGNVHG